MTDSALLDTPLRKLHEELGGKLVPFAGYAMPVQYPAGIKAEHLHCRESASLFDVSHMGQVMLTGDGIDAAVEKLLPGNIVDLKPGRIRYTMLTNEQGGILDDLMVSRLADNRLFTVVNAACKEQDIGLMRDALGDSVTVMADRALLALQGPKAAEVFESLAPAALDMTFMEVREDVAVAGVPCLITRSGYTGEDGWEISCPADRAEELARALLDHPAVEPCGLGARDSLRLEAGLCLYGADLDETTTPVEANLTWAIQKARREAGDYPGFARIRHHLVDGPARLRVGLRPEGRAPMRAGTPLFAEQEATRSVGEVTSGAHGPSTGCAISMGYVGTAHAALGTPLWGEVRGKRLAATVSDLPFVPARTKR